MALECRLLVNAAGLGAVSVARGIDGMPIELIPPAYLAKGNYFSCSAPAPFSHLIYPVPEPGGLGVHLTLDLGDRPGSDPTWNGSTRSTTPSTRHGRRVDPAIRRYWPTLPDGALMPSYSGIRPKIVPPAVAAQDFLIQGPRDHGVVRADQSVRNRIAGTYVITGDRGHDRSCGGELGRWPGREPFPERLATFVIASSLASERILRFPALCG